MSLFFRPDTPLDALSHNALWHLDMGLLKAANSTPLSWDNNEATPYSTDYVPVMALAQNHIHFLDVPGVPAGSADIFVIHCTCVVSVGHMACLIIW